MTLGDKADLVRARPDGPADQPAGPQARGPDAVGRTLPCQAKIRYNHDPQPARVTVTGAGRAGGPFDEPQGAVTPGQAVVLYDGDVVLGGGWIESKDSLPERGRAEREGLSLTMNRCRHVRVDYDALVHRSHG